MPANPNGVEDIRTHILSALKSLNNYNLNAITLLIYVFQLTNTIKTYRMKLRKEKNRRITWLSLTLKKVEAVVSWVRDKKITGYRISKETNAREMSIIALAQGRAKVKNISFETALGLI